MAERVVVIAALLLVGLAASGGLTAGVQLEVDLQPPVAGLLEGTQLTRDAGDQGAPTGGLDPGSLNDPSPGERDGPPGGIQLDRNLGSFVADADGDGLSDGQETVLGTDPHAADSDGDSLTDAREMALGTDPLAADTDSDGLEDGAEIRKYHTSPLSADTDGDGLDDAREVLELRTDAGTSDTDGDGLSNAAEIELGTDPASADTDGDGLDDRAELDEWQTNATVADTDGDGLVDGREVSEVGTDPLEPDTDGDGLEDGPEVRQYGTDPTRLDSDGDGLNDGTEVDEQGTDPTAADTDGDGLPDGAEAAVDGPVSAGDPLRKDVFVEVDYMAGHRPSNESLEIVRRAYRAAPVSNPDGSQGITLHVIVDGTVPSDGITSNADLRWYRRSHFNRSGQGYHYGVAVHDAGEDVSGFSLGTGLFAFQTERRQGDMEGRRYDARHLAGVFMHELGHSLGIQPTDFEGVDSHEVPYDEYPSIMNYNAPSDAVRYNDGTPFDGWERIADGVEQVNATALVDEDDEGRAAPERSIETESGAATGPRFGAFENRRVRSTPERPTRPRSRSVSSRSAS